MLLRVFPACIHAFNTTQHSFTSIEELWYLHVHAPITYSMSPSQNNVTETAMEAAKTEWLKCHLSFFDSINIMRPVEENSIYSSSQMSLHLDVILIVLTFRTTLHFGFF